MYQGKKTSLMTSRTPSSLNLNVSARTTGELIRYNLQAVHLQKLSFISSLCVEFFLHIYQLLWIRLFKPTSRTLDPSRHRICFCSPQKDTFGHRINFKNFKGILGVSWSHLNWGNTASRHNIITWEHRHHICQWPLLDLDNSSSSCSSSLRLWGIQVVKWDRCNYSNFYFNPSEYSDTLISKHILGHFETFVCKLTAVLFTHVQVEPTDYLIPGRHSEIEHWSGRR